MARITLDGGEIDYLLIPGTNNMLPPLVLLHEGLGCIAIWRRFPHQLGAMTGRTVLIYSRFGYGHSSPTNLPRSSDYMHIVALAVMPTLLSRLSLSDPVLIGHSDGASIALLYASENPVSGLVLMAPHVFVEDITLRGIEVARHAFQRGELIRELAFFHLEPTAVFLNWSEVWCSAAFRDWNIEYCLPKISAPILLLQGAYDEYGTQAQLDAIEHLKGDATLSDLCSV